MGHLIPAGTGLMRYKSLVVKPPEGEEDDLKIENPKEEDLDEEVRIAQTFAEEVQRGDIDGEVRRRELDAELSGEAAAEGGVIEAGVDESHGQDDLDPENG